MDEKGLNGKKPVAATNDAASRRLSRDSYETAIGIFAGIRERLEKTPFAGTLAEEPESSIAVEWGYALSHAETAARYAFQGYREDAVTYAWLSVEASNRSEAYFNLKWAEHRLRDHLIPNTRLADNMFVTAQRLAGALKDAMPGWEVLGVLDEELAGLDGWPESLACACDDLCGRVHELYSAIAESGGGEGKVKPLAVLKEVSAFKAGAVYDAVGEAFRCVGALAYLGGFAASHIQGAARFCRKNGVDWDALLEMADALRCKRLWTSHSVDEDEVSHRKGKKGYKIDSAVAVAMADCLAGTASSAPAGGMLDAPVAVKPLRTARDNGKRDGRRGKGGKAKYESA